MTLPIGYSDPTWQRCYDCGKGIPAVSWVAHIATHIDRPYDDALTLPEVAKATGIRLRTIQRRVQDGRLVSFQTQKAHGVRLWVMREEMVRFVRRQLKKHPGLAVSWAASGKLK